MAHPETDNSSFSIAQSVSALSLKQKRNLYETLKHQQVKSLKPRIGQQLLIAFVTVKQWPDDEKLFLQRLKSSLVESLPHYAVPKKVYLLKAIPKLVSGKIDKLKLKQLSQQCIDKEQKAGQFKSPTAPEEEPGNRVDETKNPIPEAVFYAWSSVLNCRVSSLDDNFFELGGDSILSIHVVSRLLQAGYKIGPNDLFDYPTVAQLSDKLARNTAVEISTTNPFAVNSAPITPTQAWFFETVTTAKEQWNMARLFKLSPAVSDVSINNAIDKLVASHDAFRISFVVEAGQYKQQLSAKTCVELEHVDLGNGPISVDDVINRSSQRQTCFNLAQAPLIRFTLFKTSCDRLLLVTAHHLVMDIVSWQILRQALINYLSAENFKSPTKSTAFTAWAAYQNNLAEETILKNQTEFWNNSSNKLSSRFIFDSCEQDKLGSVSVEVNTRIIKTQLSLPLSQALRFDVHHCYQTTIPDILLSVLALAIREQFDRAQTTIDIEGHGRIDPNGQIDLSRTIGWFSVIYPLMLNTPVQVLTENDLIGSTIKSTKENYNSIKYGGIGYGLLQQTNQLQNLADLPDPRILFNYMGTDESPALVETTDSLITMLDVDIPQQRHTENQRAHLIEIQAVFKARQLHIDWYYDHKLIEEKQLQRFIECCHQTLLQVISHCQDNLNSSYTPSDFPDAELDQQALDNFLDSL